MARKEGTCHLQVIKQKSGNVHADKTWSTIPTIEAPVQALKIK